jgi:undecaprenyl-diphosphatase
MAALPPMRELLQAALLGLIEGVTEFLPISSTGHLILLIDILGFAAPQGRIFEVVIQLGAILAVCFAYHQRITSVVLHLHDRYEARHFVLLLLCAFLPAAIVGVTLHEFIKETLFSPLVVAIMLIVGGVVILVIERFKPAPTIHSVDHMTIRHALIIGFCQALSMIPGTSRSGATMMGALCIKIDRKTAAEFSFLLAIPTMLSAAAYDLYKNHTALSFHDVTLIAVGFISAFLAALCSVRWLLAFLTRYGFSGFAWYRILFGSFMLWMILA